MRLLRRWGLIWVGLLLSVATATAALHSPRTNAWWRDVAGRDSLTLVVHTSASVNAYTLAKAVGAVVVMPGSNGHHDLRLERRRLSTVLQHPDVRAMWLDRGFSLPTISSGVARTPFPSLAPPGRHARAPQRLASAFTDAVTEVGVTVLAPLPIVLEHVVARSVGQVPVTVGVHTRSSTPSRSLAARVGAIAIDPTTAQDHRLRVTPFRLARLLQDPEITRVTRLP